MVFWVRCVPGESWGSLSGLWFGSAAQGVEGVFGSVDVDVFLCVFEGFSGEFIGNVIRAICRT